MTTKPNIDPDALPPGQQTIEDIQQGSMDEFIERRLRELRREVWWHVIGMLLFAVFVFYGFWGEGRTHTRASPRRCRPPAATCSRPGP